MLNVTWDSSHVWRYGIGWDGVIDVILWFVSYVSGVCSIDVDRLIWHCILWDLLQIYVIEIVTVMYDLMGCTGGCMSCLVSFVCRWLNCQLY